MKKTISLKTKILLLTLGALSLVQLVNIIQFTSATKQQRASIVDTFGIYANGLSEAIGAQFFERYGDVQAFAKNSVFQSSDQKQMIAALDSYVSLYGIYDVILFVDTQGRLIASNSIDPQGNSLDVEQLKTRDFSSDDWFQNTLAKKFTEDPKKGFIGTYIEDVNFDPISSAIYKKDILGNSFSCPVFNADGSIKGIITNRANFKWVENEFQTLYKNMKARGFETTNMVMTNNQGKVVINFDPSANNSSLDIQRDKNILLKLDLKSRQYPAALAILEGKEGNNFSPNPIKNNEEIVGYTSIRTSKFIDSLGWGVLVRMDKSDLFKVVSQSEVTFFSWAAGLSFFAILACLKFASSIAGKVTDIISRITIATSEVSNSTDQMSKVSLTISTGTTQTAASIETTVASLEELSAMTTRNTESAQVASQLSQDSTGKAKKGESDLTDLVAAMSSVDKSSKKISEIITVIDDIAFQTNLLALNAAVEAARAGEQGKGFAVVAEAVRALALRSTVAAKEIHQLIQDNVEMTNDGQKKVGNTEDTLKDILASIHKIADLNAAISSASSEQTSGISQVNNSMTEIDSAAQQNAAASEELAASAENMASQAQQLHLAISELSSLVLGSHSRGETRANAA